MLLNLSQWAFKFKTLPKSTCTWKWNHYFSQHSTILHFLEQIVTLTLDWQRQRLVKTLDLWKKYRNNIQTRPLLLCVWFKMVVAFKISAAGTIFFPLLDAIKQAQGKTLVIYTLPLSRGFDSYSVSCFNLYFFFFLLCRNQKFCLCGGSLRGHALHRP